MTLRPLLLQPPQWRGLWETRPLLISSVKMRGRSCGGFFLLTLPFPSPLLSPHRGMLRADGLHGAAAWPLRDGVSARR